MRQGKRATPTRRRRVATGENSNAPSVLGKTMTKKDWRLFLGKPYEFWFDIDAILEEYKIETPEELILILKKNESKSNSHKEE